ncbi:MAG: tryptophan--tRNA ligase [Thermoplasmatota archaeon]
MDIDPWGSNQVTDYARLRDQFGIEPFTNDQWGSFDNPHRLMKRGLIFGHRDFSRVRDAIRGKDPWSVMTGLMPSGDMHLGHKMVMDQVIGHQQHGADVHIAVADYEAVAARGFTLEKARDIALNQYVHNHLALGLLPENGEVYFQTKRNRVRTLADQFSQKVNWSQMQAMYGFGGDTNIAHVMAPLVQAGDILHVQKDELGPRPVLVPVGVDQDPHIRLARDIAQSHRKYNLVEQKDGWVLTIKGDDKRWLDVADGVLDNLGVGTRTDRKRNDKHGQIHLGRSITQQTVREIDLALARAEAKKGELGLVRPSATFHRFMTGLQGGKMSSSKPETSVYLTEDPASAKKKLMSSVTGGKQSADEQRRDGGEPAKCPVYELFLYHLADDEHLQQVHDECVGGERLCGGCKTEAAEHLMQFLSHHKERRDETAHLVQEIVSED